MSDLHDMDELLGISFGDFVPQADSVLVSMHVRTRDDAGNVAVGTRDPVLMDWNMLRTVLDFLPQLVSTVAGFRAGHTVAPAADSTPLPAWNDGPRPPLGRPLYQCTGFGIRDPDPTIDGVVAVIGGAPIGADPEDGVESDYLISYRALLGLQESLAKVIARVDAQDFRPLKEADPATDGAAVSRPPAERVCVHITVPEILSSISSVRLQFHTQMLGQTPSAGETTEVVVPFQVLYSFAQALPQLLTDMNEMGANQPLFETGKPH
ncbi:hypothetical protein [uncultured Luteimonas sp.]|uniref:hypothetical protein n=1 Tax=uncultured Luteimonas sp. TaxID=453144 RepID=UPI00260CA3D3|nr:hypothetical protein [uncultured Luteimonas sp.]